VCVCVCVCVWLPSKFVALESIEANGFAKCNLNPVAEFGGRSRGNRFSGLI
jgi:hypothetical protein